MHHGEQTPVFFGSAANNFGVQLLLDAFLERSLRRRRCGAARGQGGREVRRQRQAGTRSSDLGRPWFRSTVPSPALSSKFRQIWTLGNRDRIAFLRICSGKFSRDMSVTHQRTGKRVRLSSAHRLFAQDRETVERGLRRRCHRPRRARGIRHRRHARLDDPNDWAIARSRASLECFSLSRTIRIPQSTQFRQWAWSNLPGKVVVLFEFGGICSRKSRSLAAVGPLQSSEVVQYRLESEYGAPRPWKPPVGKRFSGSPGPDPQGAEIAHRQPPGFDSAGLPGYFPEAPGPGVISLNKMPEKYALTLPPDSCYKRLEK